MCNILVQINYPREENLFTGWNLASSPFLGGNCHPLESLPKSQYRVLLRRMVVVELGPFYA